MDGDQDTQPSDIMAPPRKPAAKPAPAKTAPPDGAVSDGRAGDGPQANGAPASGKGTEETSSNGASANGSPAAANATLVDGVPALPADTIGSVGPDRETTKSKAAAPAEADDSPIFSFGPPPPAAKPPAEPAPAKDPPSLSPAAFAWEMPDPPPQSPSSPARAFLRSGTGAKRPAAKSRPAPKASPSAGPGTTTAAAARPAPADKTQKAQKAQKPQPKRMARQAHLTVARVEPWSVMKFSFVVSLVAFVILFVAVSLLYATLSGLGVFDSLQHLVKSLTSSQDSQGVNAKTWFSASKVLGYTALLGSLNIVLITAMSTVGAVVYNLTSRLVGGVEVTLRETE